MLRFESRCRGLETPISAFGDTGFGQSEIMGQVVGSISVVSNPAIAEEDGGTSGQTASYKYERFESCVAIAGADYCVMAADYTGDHSKISQLTEKIVMASCGFQAAAKAFQKVFSVEILGYEHQHKKRMSCLEINHLLSKVLLCEYPEYFPFTVLLGGIDSKGKGRIFTHCDGGGVYDCDGGSGYNSREEPIVPPIFEYKLPSEDVLTRLSETEAVDLAKSIFASTTRTWDRLEIVVIKASGLRYEHVDLRNTPAFVPTFIKNKKQFGATSALASAFDPTFIPTFGCSTRSAFGVSNSLFGGKRSNSPNFGSASMTPFYTKSSPFGASSSPAFCASSTPAFGLETPISAFGDTGFGQSGIIGQVLGSISVVSNPAITEEDGGTSGRTASYKYERFESCVAIAGADYCVMAADYTGDHSKISQLTENSVMASCGFQAISKAMRVVMSVEILLYEHDHKKRMSCSEINLLLSKVLLYEYPEYFPFTLLLGGIDNKGKGCIFTHSDEGVGYKTPEEPIVPPILEYKLPAEDVLTRLSETEAVHLAKTIFASTTHTGDKLEIVVIKASGLRLEHVDLRASPMI